MEDEDIKKLTKFLTELNKNKTISLCSPDYFVNIHSEHCNSKTSLNTSRVEKKIQYLQQCLKYNADCFSLLNIIESYLVLLLEECLNEQRIVNASIDSLIWKKRRSSDDRIGPCLGTKFRVPYFKDIGGFSHPSNEDVKTRTTQGFVNQFNILVPRPWHEYEKGAVLSCIRKVEEEKWIQTMKACGLLHMVNVHHMSLAELVESRFDEYDWLKISVSTLKNVHSPHECRAMWFTCLHPEINQQVWSEEENKMLRDLVKQYKGQDWDKIAHELGTKRTALKCIKHFKLHLCDKNKCEWTKNEINLLKIYVKVFGISKFIPWRKIAMLMDGRNSTEMLWMWMKMNAEGKPQTFSLEEDIVLITGMRLFGNDYSRIKEYLPERSARQICRRTEILKGRQFPRQPWSREEDKLLKLLVEQYGFGNWLKISLHFVNRNPGSVRKRYTTLQNNKNMYGDGKSCGSVLVRNPRYSTDIVNINLLWEMTQEICQQNHICRNVNSIMKSNSVVNIVNELSKILNPAMRCSRTIDKKKLQTSLKKVYFNFFKGAYKQNENESCQTDENGKMICSSAYYALLVSKLLEARVTFPAVEEIEKDKSISELDKRILQYLISKLIEPETTKCNIDLELSSVTKVGCTLHASEETTISDNEFTFLFPSNIATLISLRSILLNYENLEEQKEGLTTQVDNIEWKHVNTCCAPKDLFCKEKYNKASKLWNKRIYLLLCCVTTLLNDDKQAYNSALNLLCK